MVPPATTETVNLSGTLKVWIASWASFDAFATFGEYGSAAYPTKPADNNSNTEQRSDQARQAGHITMDNLGREDGGIDSAVIRQDTAPAW
jgi:hypothetical protein